MNKIILVIVLFCFLSPHITAQNSASSHGDRIRDEVIYLILDSNRLEYFPGHQSADSRKNVSGKMKFSLEDHQCNLYLKWINPLKYQLSFRDTIYIDERDKIIADFIKDLASQFGIFAETSEEERTIFKSAFTKDSASCSRVHVLYIPDKGFHDNGLNSFYMSLLSGSKTLNDDDIQSINSLTRLVEDLDIRNAFDINKKLNEMYTYLFNLDDPIQARKSIDQCSIRIEEYKTKYEEIPPIQEEVLKNLREIKISYKPFESFIRAAISEFVYRTALTLDSNKNLASRMESVIDIVRTSLKDESAENETKGYFRVKHIEFEEGKKLESSIQITKFRLNPDILYKADKNMVGNVIKDEVIERTMVFEKYDLIRVWGSAGLFYSSTSLTGFGVSTSPAGELTVTEDTIKRNSPVAAIFLNFDFDIGSRYLAPLIQIGIDPTKTRPFMLLGVGLSIPCKRFAITGGPIWTWNQSLDKLSVGQTIWSTTYLEKDIKYEFDMKPKGWYLGIQYKF